MATPTQPSFIPEPWAETSGNFDTIPATQQETGRASWENGFPLENTIPVAEGGTPSHYLDFQGVLNALSSFAWWQQRGGQFTWSQDLEYPVGAFVLGSDGQLYKSIQASSPSAPQNPITATAYWTIADPTAFLPLSGGTLTGNLLVYRSQTSGDTYIRIARSSSNTSGRSDVNFMVDNTIGATLRYADGGSTLQLGLSPDIATKTWYQGSLINLEKAGNFDFRAQNAEGNSKHLIGKPDGTFTWNGQPIQTSSDERLKTGFSTVPNDVLDAWGKVGWSQFKFKEDAERKGLENCRWHPGLVAQRVKAVFEEEGLDACAYGILCHDEWDDEYEDVEVVDVPETKDEEGKIVPAVTHTEHKLVREAGDLWTIRYEEALAMEAAYQRRRADRLEARLDAIEKRLSELDGDLR